MLYLCDTAIAPSSVEAQARTDTGPATGADGCITSICTLTAEGAISQADRYSMEFNQEKVSSTSFGSNTYQHLAAPAPSVTCTCTAHCTFEQLNYLSLAWCHILSSNTAIAKQSSSKLHYSCFVMRNCGNTQAEQVNHSTNGCRLPAVK